MTDSIDILLKLKRNLELFKSVLNEISNKNHDDLSIIGDKDAQYIVNVYNTFFNPSFISGLSQDTEQIISQMNSVIQQSCKHELTCDYTDICPERSVPFQYCIKCYTAF